MAKWKSKKERSRLVKLGLKSVFTHKIFTILMTLLIFISGATYTLLISSNESFNKSYNQVTTEGNLHEYVVKENFKPAATSKKVIEIYDPTAGTTKEYNDTNLESIAKASKTADGHYKIEYIVTQGSTGDYASLKDQKITVTVKDDGNASFTEEMTKLKNEFKSFSSHIEFLAERNLTKQFVSDLKTRYQNQAWFNANKSISVTSDEKAFNVVQYNSDTEVNKMFVYDGTDKVTLPLSEADMLTELRKRIDNTGQSQSDFTFETTKGFRISARSATGSSISVTDPSSYQAIISPGYANKNDKVSITPKEFLDIWSKRPTIMDDLVNPATSAQLLEKYKQNIVWVDKTPYFVIGIGTTPDYLYPIVDQAHPVIDVQNQATLFVNQRGYERIYDAFRTNPKEEYISMKFKPGVSNSDRDRILKEIEHSARQKTGYPQNIKMVTSAFDPNDQMLLTQERVMFLKDLDKTIGTISYVTTTLLVVFVAAIVILVFRMLINMDRKVLATQLALGYSKRKIALTKTLGGLFIVVIPVFLAYIVGYFMQFWFIGEFDNYWTIPTWGTSFSLVTLIVTVIVPLVTISALIYIITQWTLRRPVTELLNGTSSKSSTALTKFVSKFKIIGVKGRYSLALTAKNSFKLFLVSVASIISLTALTVGVSSVGRADTAYTKTVEMNNYEFAVDLYTPTAQGGLYTTEKAEDLISLRHEPSSGMPVSSSPEWHIPSTGDATLGLSASASSHLSEASKYLKNKIQVKTLLDHEVSGMNPWDIAERLMPDNQKNKAKENGAYIESQTPLPLETGQDPAVETPRWRKVAKVLSERGDERTIPYMITYGVVLENQGDEEYTHLDATLNKKNYKIMGVDQNTKMVNISSDLQKVKDYKGSNVPILINHYIREKMKLDVGSTIDMEISNGYHRMENGKSSFTRKAEIVGIVEGYDDKGIYTTKQRANSVLELPANGFNGVFTKNKNPEILGSLPLYSPSGIWMGTDTIVGPWENVLSSMIADDSIWSPQFRSTVAADANEFFAKFSRTPFVGATSTVLWSEISRFTFKNISHLSSFIIEFIEGIAIALSVIFTVVIASLLLISNRKKIATLWTMGYRKREITRMFLATYILPTAVAIIIAMPISFAVLVGMKSFIMGFGNILIPFTVTWFAPLIAVGVVAAIFIGATFLTINTQKQQKALEAFKGD